MKPTCIKCKFFKIEDTRSGYCRVKGRETEEKTSPRPLVQLEDTCEKWTDCGQQYHIRLGWIRSREAREQETSP